MGSFETETLSSTEIPQHLIDLSGKLIDQAHRHRKLTRLILDMDSSVSETYGHQQGTAYNGYFDCLCYLSLFLFNRGEAGRDGQDGLRVVAVRSGCAG